MLATIPRAAPRAARRALTTGAATRAPLAPPYEHSVRSSLAAPYAQHITPAQDRIQPSYAYTLLQSSAPAATPSAAEWVAGVLGTEAGRKWALGAWDAALAELSEQPASVPEIPFQALTAVLADSSMRELFQRAGGLVVRDVVRDALAEAWAAELIAARAARAQPTFHNEAQVAARSDCSVLSATSQVLRALAPSPAAAESYIRVDAATSAPATTSWSSTSLWDASSSAAGPSTPVNAHLALARTELAVPTCSAAVTYALLRPHFTAKASRISFYSSADYLAAKNWTLRDDVSAKAADYEAEHVHLRPASVGLAPGDVLVSHAGLPLAAADAAGLVLPVHPLPATESNKAFVALQRAAYEAGLPPPHVATDGLVALEPAGDAAWIESHAGRRAMGYDA